MGTSNMPVGFGVWIAFQDTVGTWDESIKRLKSIGAKWVAPRAGAGLGRDVRWSPAEAKTAIKKFHDAGIKVYPWLYSYPKTCMREVAIFKALMDEGADGIFIDAEAEFQGKGEHKPLAEQFLKALRASVGEECYVGHAPFPYIAWHLDFPYVEFGRYCDDVHPQTYWTEINDAGAAKHLKAVQVQWDTHAVKHPEILGRSGEPIRHIGVTYGSELRGALKGPPGVFKASDLELFVNWCKAQNLRSYSVYSLDAACPPAMAKMKELANLVVVEPTVIVEEESMPVPPQPVPVEEPKPVEPVKVDPPVAPIVPAAPKNFLDMIMQLIKFVLALFGRR